MEIEQAALLIPIALLVLVLGLFVALPVGVLVGLPLLAAGRNFLPSHILTFTVMFALVGLLGGFIVENLVEDSGHVMLIFGACVGGMHPLVLARANGVRWPKLAASFLLSAAIVPSVAYAGEDAGNLMASEDEFEALCADPYGEMASIQVREPLGQDTLRNLYIGKWINRGEFRSLYAWQDEFPLDETRDLVARDYAFVPGGFAGWITGGRRVARHCLSEKQGSDADMLRARGVGKPPTIEDLAD